MQDDQTTGSDDSSAKDTENSSNNPGELTLSGSSSPASGDSIPDPALEALEAKPIEDPAPSSPAPQTEPADEPASTPSASSTTQSDDTLDPIKKEALQKLEPLVGELDLNPEEKYRALMMIIQATDNKDLVNEAYQAAEKIEDNKTRAQALLSIINEIDYFKNKEKV